ncbi:MAG TPA: hypothetical protein VEF34_06930, partial [Syntrophobacteraceae bacterium]|nr:hypothetical protein [Syntrophobacteraceae bacterium]
ESCFARPTNLNSAETYLSVREEGLQNESWVLADSDVSIGPCIDGNRVLVFYCLRENLREEVM